MDRNTAAVDSESELATILEGIGEGFYALDVSWCIRRFNKAAERHFGTAAQEVLGRNLWETFPGSRDTALGQLFIDTMAQRNHVQSETESVVFAGRWLSYRLFPLGDGLGVVFRDITDRKRAEAQRDLLVRELHHRLANTFSTIQAIAGQTFRNSNVDMQTRETFSQRLINLSRAHMALTSDNWNSADLYDVIATSLTPYEMKDRDRITITGPKLRLSPQSAIAISMAIHELSTNAAKYGALSSDVGKLAIDWKMDDRFTLTWRESDGPQVTPPMKSGFGTTMLQRALAQQLQGNVTLEFKTAGVVCTIDAPPTAVIHEGQMLAITLPC
jgi:PAS domain S-box-containing protein